jgi:hypothetical protein
VNVGVYDRLQGFADGYDELCSRTTRAARVEEDGATVAWIVWGHFGGRFCDGDGDAFVGVCCIEVVEWNA